MIGNAHTSRVWKGERRNEKADSLTRESAFKFFLTPILSPEG
jgi:hypothetical protein